MRRDTELDIVVYGATGYTGRLVAEHLSERYGLSGGVRWAMAGRSLAKLTAVRDEIGAPADIPLLSVDATDPDALRAMVGRTGAVITTVGPYQLYGSGLVEACAATGTDYLDLCGEPNWMRAMIEAHEATAKASGARILFSCGFDSIPSELGVWFCQQVATSHFGRPAPRVKGRVRSIHGGLSGGTAASGAATAAAIKRDPAELAVMMSPFGLTPGFQGPDQPDGEALADDPDVGPVAPFMMAVINTKNVHRSNLLMGHPYGRDFLYDEMVLGTAAGPRFTDLGTLPGAPSPGKGPTKAERDAGSYDILFIGLDGKGAQVRTAVKGDKDPGYGSTSKIIAETAMTLLQAPDVPAGIWTPGAALQGRLVERLADHAGLTFQVEGWW